MNNLKIDGRVLTQSEQTVAWIIFGIGALVFLLSIGLFFMWIYYSWIRRSNSKNYTGADITQYLFDKTGTKVEVKSAWMYIKYWNYNKRRATHKLRPWTYSRRSIWTLMEASQQAYATTIRQSKGKQFWLIFRLPNLFKFLGIVLSGFLIYHGVKDIDNFDSLEFKNWLWIGMGISALFIGYTIADAGRVFILWRNVVPLLKDSGLNEQELKAINRIYFWRLVYSMAVVLLELIKLVLQIMEQANKVKSSN